MSVPNATPQRAGHAPASSSQQSFAPRSSTIPHSMGHSQSKPVPPLPSSSPATKGFNAAVAGGIRLKRAFAGRRKKSEEQDSKPTVAPRIESSVSAPPQFPSRATVVSPASIPPTPPKKDSPPQDLNFVGNRNSIMPISPGISSAVNYISMVDQQKQELDKEKKENWRKSDSTNSHHTICPGGGAAKSSRPVSWAESLQSTHTVVQTSGRRLSALIGDADFGMPEAEEDDDDDRTDSISHLPDNSPSSPSAHRRAISQGIPVAAQPFPLPPLPPSPPSAPATITNYPSHSISEGFSINPINYSHHRPLPQTTPSASQPQPQNLRGRTLYISPPVSTAASQQERGHTAAPQQQRPLPSHPSSAFYPSPPPIGSTSSTSASASFRQTTISMTSGGIGPVAAGLAKRAVEKSKKWAIGMGMSSSGSATSGSGYWSSGSSSHTGSMGGPSSYTSTQTDNGLVSMGSRESMSGVHKHHLHGMGHRRTPGPGSGATSTSAAGSISSSSITSLSDASSSDPFAQPSGPMLGRKLRGGVLTKNGAKMSGGRAVFGRSLAVAVRETGIFVGKAPGTQVEGHPKEGLVRELEERMLPAVVVRCAQHILLWGVQEEGLFRVSGRPTHSAKLRAEFDSGADYDMTETTPGDLDPHAVASVFKAYLRELPETILTCKLSPLFDAAVNKETTINADTDFGGGSSGSMRLGARPGLPTNGPKSGFAIRKPPSLSTLAMPTFSAIPAPSSTLVHSLRTLVSQLPQENRDLLRTVVELIRATAVRSKETKMPLSNLLLVFCPSLNMTPPLLRALCEAEEIWEPVCGNNDGKEGEKLAIGSVIDIRRQTMPARSPIDKEGGGFFADEPTTYTSKTTRNTTTEEESESVRSGRASLDTTDNNPSSDYHASAEESIYDDEYEMLGEVAPRRRIPRERLRERREEVPTVYLDCSSSVASSLDVQEDLAGSEEVSMSYLQHSREAARDDDGSISSGSVHAPSPPPLLSSSSDSPLSSGNPSFSHLPLEHEQHQEKEDQDQLSQHHDHRSYSRHQHHEGSGPEIVNVTPRGLRPLQSQTGKRLVISDPIPIPVQFPTSPPQQRSASTPTAQKRRSIPMLSLPNFSSTKDKGSPSRTPSPIGSPSSLSVGPENFKSLNRSKKPSLKLLFSKRSASSLTSERDRTNSIGSGKLYISAPIPQTQQAASMVSLSPEWSPKPQTLPRSASDSTSSSVSTPISAVTAPQSQASSHSSLPPVLDTPIEGASFGFDLGFDMGLTPTHASTITSTSTDTPSNNSRSQQQQQPINPSSNLPPGIHPLSTMHQSASTSNLSIASTATSNHLSLFDDDDDGDEGMEDWTQSVLLAADVDVLGVQKSA